MRNRRALIAYDGSSFFGWQRQDGFASVQQALEEAIAQATGEIATAHGAGRTDTGVHALGQVASFHLESALDDDRLRHALNYHLPEGVAVRRLETCADDFHARYAARGKRYVYTVATARFRPPIGRAYAHWVPHALDLRAMRAAAALLVGRHDFRAFGNTGSERKTTVRTLARARWLARRERLALVLEADGFLYNMARTIAGTLLDVGRGKLAPAAVARALESGERDDAGVTAPAHGLCLLSVRYPERAFAGRDRGPHGAPGAFQY
jgi:tRNA pseudouridine38-40 synthase